MEGKIKKFPQGGVKNVAVVILSVKDGRQGLKGEELMILFLHHGHTNVSVVV